MFCSKETLKDYLCLGKWLVVQLGLELVLFWVLIVPLQEVTGRENPYTLLKKK